MEASPIGDSRERVLEDWETQINADANMGEEERQEIHRQLAQEREELAAMRTRLTQQVRGG